MEKKLLVLIDLSSIWCAAWHASADEELSAAFQTTVSKVHSLISDAEADYVAVCLDTQPYTCRTAIYPEYKGQREKPTATRIEQFRRVRERLVKDGLLLWSAEGYEADDVIATACKIAVTKHNLRVTVVSADKDLLQLVDDKIGPVRVYSPQSQTFYDRSKVIEKFGVAPEDMLDFLALMGDKSDNVPGVTGVGPKTAARLLMTYRDFDSVFANAGKEAPKTRDALITDAPKARLARKLIALQDVPIRFDELFEERKAMPITEPTPEPEPGDAFEEEPPPQKPPAPGPGLAKTDATILPRPAEWSMQLEPRSGKQAFWLAEKMANSRVFAKFGSPDAIFMVILRGRALGLDAMAAAAAFHRIGDQLAMHADLIEALVLRSGKAETWELVETTPRVARYITKRKGSSRDVAMTFTIQDAYAAQLVERHEKGLDGLRGISNSGKPSNWDKYRATMLRHRCKTQLARAVYPDVVLGLYTPDEISDGRAIDAEIEAA